MQRLYLCILLALLSLSACARPTVPSVEEGWVPIDEWNRRVQASDRRIYGHAWANTTAPGPASVRTTCYHGKRYTRCTTY